MASLIVASISQILGGSNSKSKTGVNSRVASSVLLSHSDTDFDVELDSSLGRIRQGVVKTESARIPTPKFGQFKFPHIIKNSRLSDSAITGSQEKTSPFRSKTSDIPTYGNRNNLGKGSQESYANSFCGKLGNLVENQDWESAPRKSFKITTAQNLAEEKMNFGLSMENPERISHENKHSLSHSNQLKIDLETEGENCLPDGHHKFSGDHFYSLKEHAEDIPQVDNRKIKVHEPEPFQSSSSLKMNPMLGIGFSPHGGYTVEREQTPSWDHMLDFTSGTNTDRSPSKTSSYSDSGVSAMYTSTPIKSSGNPQDVDAHNSFPRSPQSHSTLLTHSDSRPGLSLSQTSSFNITPASMHDESLSYILEAGDEEFREKYSSWVSQLFHLQLAKMQRRLSYHFSRKIDALNREKHQQIVGIQQNNRDKLLEFEQATIKFQKWIETLTEENRRLKATREAIVNEMEKATKQSEINFHVELDSHVNNIQAEFEKEKLILQENHGQQLKIFLDKSCSQIEKVENEYREQVDTLTQTIKELKIQQDNLEEQIQSYKRSSESGGPNALRPPATSGSYCFRREKEHLLSVIQDQRNRLYDLEKEKLATAASHQEEIDKLNAIIHKNEKGFMLKWEASQRNFELLHRANANELQMLKSKLSKQEADSHNIISGLREKYGTKIHQLAEMVESLHLQMDEQEPSICGNSSQ